MNDFEMKIKIPADKDGYVLLKCPKCGCCFKILTEDLNNDRIINLHCPQCGLISDSYLTEEVVKLAMSMVNNYINDMFYDSFERLEKSTKNSSLQFKAGSKPKHEEETPIRDIIDKLEVKKFNCCNKTAKVKPLLNVIGPYCPFCGVKAYEDE